MYNCTYVYTRTTHACFIQSARQHCLTAGDMMQKSPKVLGTPVLLEYSNLKVGNP